MSTSTRRRVPPVLSWATLAVVLSVALAIGAARGASPATPAQRAAAIDAMVRCPSCDGISVAESSSSTAVAVRQAVASRVRAGQSDDDIEAFLVSRYGPGILLRPPVRGGTIWVWLVPPAAGVAAIVALAAVAWRRRRRSVPAVSATDHAVVAQALAGRARMPSAPPA
jgi:cytochrome c-type biogenesis protein CcmH